MMTTTTPKGVRHRHLWALSAGLDPGGLASPTTDSLGR